MPSYTVKIFGDTTAKESEQMYLVLNFIQSKTHQGLRITPLLYSLCLDEDPLD